MRTIFKSKLFAFTIRLLVCGMLFHSGSLVAQQNKLPAVKQVAFPRDTVRIDQFGAKGDGQFLNTEAINTAILTCSQKGGGVVLIPTGLWFSGPIEMQSNVNLHVERDAVLLFTSDFNQYEIVESNSIWLNQSPISGKNLENIAITGTGIIDGNGGAWRFVKKDKLTEWQWKKLVGSGGVVDKETNIWYPTESSFRGVKKMRGRRLTPAPAGTTKESLLDIKDFLRPNMIVFTSCKRILLEDVTFQNSPAWNLHPLMCEDLTMRNVVVRNPWNAQNSDGVDVESCKNVLIEHCTFDVGDDAICIKSGRDKYGRDRGMPSENIIIRNCIVYHGHGGFVIGSEMSGGARNIWVDNCSFIGTDIGLRFKTTRGRGGVVENIYINNINMFDIVGEAIFFDMYYESKPSDAGNNKPMVTDKTPQFRNFDIRNVHVKGAKKGIFIRGLPEMHVQNVNIENATIESRKGIEIIEASNISLKDIILNSSETNPLIYIDNAKNVNIDGLRPVGDVIQLVKVSGADSEAITLKGVQNNNIKQMSTVEGNASEKTIKISK